MRQSTSITSPARTVNGTTTTIVDGTIGMLTAPPIPAGPSRQPLHRPMRRLRLPPDLLAARIRAGSYPGLSSLRSGSSSLLFALPAAIRRCDTPMADRYAKLESYHQSKQEADHKSDHEATSRRPQPPHPRVPLRASGSLFLRTVPVRCARVLRVSASEASPSPARNRGGRGGSRFHLQNAMNLHPMPS